MAGLKYDRIVRYRITVATDAPLRIGSAENDKESVLVHPVDGKPFIQASSIAGALRDYCKRTGSNEAGLFGTANGDDAVDSRVYVSDGVFSENVKMELRPHVRINRKTGSASFEEVKGTDKVSGQKFNTEYIGAGQNYEFTVLLYDNSCASLEKDLESTLAGIGSGEIRFGGKKSSGAGITALRSVFRNAYDLRDPDGLKAWIENDISKQEDLTEQFGSAQKAGVEYRINIKGKTEAGIQVKGLAENTFGEDAADSSNIKNTRGEYIVPGTSFKGTIRSRMEMIAEYLGREDAIEGIFGKVGENGHAGNIYFRDAVIGDAESIDRIPIKHRLHLDKFTGGVINPFQEHNAAGEIEFEVEITPAGNPKQTLGLLILALRDLASGIVSVGNGYANGKGIINVSEIEVTDCAAGRTAEINYVKNEIADESGILHSALASLKKEIEA